MFGELFIIIGQFVIALISLLGYPGIFILMALESMIFPVPSELVMPFAGFLIASGGFDWTLVFVSSTLGSIFGSLVSYWVGAKYGHKFIVKHGKYFFLNERHLAQSEAWFKKRGEITILIARFVPVVRHLISIPAGISKMNLGKFLLYTAIGAGIWNMILAYAGFFLGVNWLLIRQYTEPLSIVVAVGLVIAVIWVLFFRKKK